MNIDNIKYFDSFEVEYIPKITKISQQIFIEYKHTIQ